MTRTAAPEDSLGEPHTRAITTIIKLRSGTSAARHRSVSYQAT
jgi:hypothetical protein